MRRAGLRVAAMCGVVAWAVASIPARAGEECRRECQEAKDERDAICRGLKTPKEREFCWRSSNNLYARCVKKCEAGPL